MCLCVGVRFRLNGYSVQNMTCVFHALSAIGRVNCGNNVYCDVDYTEHTGTFIFTRFIPEMKCMFIGIHII